MIINGVQFNAGCEEIIAEWRKQLAVNGIPLLQKEPKRSGEHLQVQCVYHGNGQERRPSAGIRMSDGMYHCFACGVVHQLHEVISYSFGHVDDILGTWGWKWLLQNFSAVTVQNRKIADLSEVFSRDNKSIKEPIKYVSEAELDGYRYIHPYMYKRGLTDEIIELFDIGYDKDTECITFPVRDITGGTLFVARRSTKSKFFSYPSGVEKPLYGLYELSQVSNLSEVIICESMLDALSFWTIGKYAAALNGLGTDLQFMQLRELPCRKLILATDSDDAGMKARERIRKKLAGTKIITEYIFPDGRKDANECTKEELKNLLEIF